MCWVSAARRVCCRDCHQLTGVTLSVMMLEAALSVEVCAVEISGIPKTCSKDLISLFFENEKRSGGGAIQDMIFDADSGVAIITFEKADGEL